MLVDNFRLAESGGRTRLRIVRDFDGYRPASGDLSSVRQAAEWRYRQRNRCRRRRRPWGWIGRRSWLARWRRGGLGLGGRCGRGCWSTCSGHPYGGDADRGGRRSGGGSACFNHRSDWRGGLAGGRWRDGLVFSFATCERGQHHAGRRDHQNSTPRHAVRGIEPARCQF